MSHHEIAEDRGIDLLPTLEGDLGRKSPAGSRGTSIRPTSRTMQPSKEMEVQ